MKERYACQERFYGLGRGGQERLSRSSAAIIGLGALGSVSAQILCRAGVRTLRLADSDRVEWGNLHRQVLYDENDAKRRVYKAEAAKTRLNAINSEVRIEAAAERIHSGNIAAFIDGADVVLDDSDNLETRMVIHEACRERGIPWIYCGVLGSRGMTMNFLPGGPCFRCLIPEPGSGYPTTSTDGVIGMIAGVMADIQAAEALKILLGDPNIRKNLFIMDVWRNETECVDIAKDPLCPACGDDKGGKA